MCFLLFWVDIHGEKALKHKISVFCWYPHTDIDPSSGVGLLWGYQQLIYFVILVAVIFFSLAATVKESEYLRIVPVMPFIISAALLLYDNALTYFAAIHGGLTFLPPLYIYRLEPATADDLFLCTESTTSYLVALKSTNADFRCESFLQYISMHPLDNNHNDLNDLSAGMVIRFHAQNSSSVPIIDIFLSSSPLSTQKHSPPRAADNDDDDVYDSHPLSLYLGMDRDYQSLVLSDVDYSYYLLDRIFPRNGDVTSCCSSSSGDSSSDSTDEEGVCDDHCSSESAAGHASPVSLHLHDIVQLSHMRRLTLDMHLLHHASLAPLRPALAIANRDHDRQQRQPSTAGRSQHAVCSSLYAAARYHSPRPVSNTTHTSPSSVSGRSLAVVSGSRANQFVTTYWLDYCGALNHWQSRSNIPVAFLWEQGEYRLTTRDYPPPPASLL